jgi:hypothetical protein
MTNATALLFDEQVAIALAADEAGDDSGERMIEW